MASIEKQIASEIAKANEVNIIKLGLRFDKVVIRLLGNIRMGIEPHHWFKSCEAFLNN